MAKTQYGPNKSGESKIIYLVEGWRDQDLIEELAHFRQALSEGYWGKGGVPDATKARWEEQIDTLFNSLGFVPDT